MWNTRGWDGTHTPPGCVPHPVARWLYHCMCRMAGTANVKSTLPAVGRERALPGYPQVWTTRWKLSLALARISLTALACCRVSSVPLGPPGPIYPEGCSLLRDDLGPHTVSHHFPVHVGNLVVFDLVVCGRCPPRTRVVAAPCAPGPVSVLMCHLLLPSPAFVCRPHTTCRVPAAGTTSSSCHPVPLWPHRGHHPSPSPPAHLASLFPSLGMKRTACHHHPDLGPEAPSTAEPPAVHSRCLPALTLHREVSVAGGKPQTAGSF